MIGDSNVKEIADVFEAITIGRSDQNTNLIDDHYDVNTTEVKTRAPQYFNE